MKTLKHSWRCLGKPESYDGEEDHSTSTHVEATDHGSSEHSTSTITLTDNRATVHSHVVPEGADLGYGGPELGYGQNSGPDLGYGEDVTPTISWTSKLKGHSDHVPLLRRKLPGIHRRNSVTKYSLRTASLRVKADMVKKRFLERQESLNLNLQESLTLQEPQTCLGPRQVSSSSSSMFELQDDDSENDSFAGDAFVECDTDDEEDLGKVQMGQLKLS